MSSKLYFHDTYWPIRGNKKIVVVCDRLSKHQTHRRVLLFKMHNDEIYMLLIKFLARLGAQEVALSVCPCVHVCVCV